MSASALVSYISLPETWQWHDAKHQRTFTWQQTSACCPAAAAWLNKHLANNTSAHNRIGICLPNSRTLVSIIEAAFKLGICLVFLNPRSEQSQVEDQIRQSKIDFVISHIDLQCDCPCLALPTLDPQCDFTFEQEPINIEDAAVVLLSSGSSGATKFIRLSFRALLHASANACDRLNMTQHNCWLACLPFYHIGGLSLIYRCAMSGCGLSVSKQFDAEVIANNLKQQAISGISLVPTMLHRLLLAHPDNWPAPLQCILIGGAAAQEQDCQLSQQRGLAVCRSYGLSEFASQIATQAMDEYGEQHCGKLLSQNKAQINASGQLLIKSPQAFSGYEEHGQLIHVHDCDEWYCTDDLAVIEQEHLKIIGRNDDVFIRGGENIALAQVIHAVEQHCQLNTFAVCTVDDSEWGTVPVLLYADDIENDELQGLLQLIPGLLRPAHQIKVQDIPLLSNGKIDRQALKKIALHKLFKR